MRSNCVLVSLLSVVYAGHKAVIAADCRIEIVGQPYSTCWDIATANGITTAQLSAFNPGLDCSLLQPGQRLCVSSGTLPDLSPKPNPDSSCARHTVLPGTWCALIAEQYHITVANIEDWNVNTYKWRGGDLVLRIAQKRMLADG
ncbi:hypothetical protein H1R20_g3663, partial [Candolleomyces eurysporus]